jgi:hypothetical protein
MERNMTTKSSRGHEVVAPKPTLFIGSSTKSRPLVERISPLLDDRFRVTPWYKAFPPAQLTLETLLSARSMYDCAVMFFAKDDALAPSVDGSIRAITRDNVVFEFGLFLGALGRTRVIVVAEQGVSEMADLKGWTYLYYHRGDDSAGPEVLELQLADIARKIKERWQPLPLADPPDPPTVTDHGLGFSGTFRSLERRLSRFRERLGSYDPDSAEETKQPEPIKLDLADACISAYADALDLVKSRFWTTTYLTSGFWSKRNADVISANRRLADRCKSGGDLRRLFITRELPQMEVLAQKEERVLLRRLQNQSELDRLNTALSDLKRSVADQIASGFQVRITRDPHAAWMQLPPEFSFQPTDSELAIYDDFRVDVFSGGRAGAVHSAWCFTKVSQNFDGLLEPAVRYFEELWQHGEDIERFLAQLDRVRLQVDAQIDYEPHWLAQYEFALSQDDEELKTVEAARLFEILRKLDHSARVKDALDIGTCTGRYPIQVCQHLGDVRRVTGIDADPDCVRFAAALVRKAGLDARITIRRADFLEDQDGALGTYELVTCMLGTASHFGIDRKPSFDDSLQKALRRMAGLLTAQGVLVLSNWSEQACENQGRGLLLIYRQEDRRMLSRWTVPLDELRKRLQLAGLEVVEEASPNVRIDMLACARTEHAAVLREQINRS